MTAALENNVLKELPRQLLQGADGDSFFPLRAYWLLMRILYHFVPKKTITLRYSAYRRYVLNQGIPFYFVFLQHGVAGVVCLLLLCYIFFLLFNFFLKRYT